MIVLKGYKGFTKLNSLLFNKKFYWIDNENNLGHNDKKVMLSHDSHCFNPIQDQFVEFICKDCIPVSTFLWGGRDFNTEDREDTNTNISFTDRYKANIITTQADFQINGMKESISKLEHNSNPT